MAPDRLDAGQRRTRALVEFAARGINLRRRDHLDAAAIEAMDALRDAGIDALLLKGAALADALYAPDLERGYFDIDLLIPPDARARSGQVLSMLGYASADAGRGIEDVAGTLHAEPWARLDAQIGNVMVDVHWKLHGSLAPAEAVWAALRGGAEPMTLSGRVVHRLGRPALALHTALHLAQHGPEDAKAAADLGLAVERWGPAVWRDAALLAAQLDAVDAFAAGLRLLPEGADIADSLGVFPTERGAWDMAHRGLRPRGTDHLTALAQAHTFSERARVLRRALLPSRAWISWDTSWASRSAAHLAAAYALHLMRAPLWAMRAYRFARDRPSDRQL